MAKKNIPLSVYQIKVTLSGSKPPIWRRLLIPSDLSLDRFHYVLQAAMGWAGGHLHQFVSGREYYGCVDPDFGLGDEVEDERKYRVAQLLPCEKASLVYEYDFGDGWEHKIVLEKILPAAADAQQVRCIKGARACPPEDCGGIWGYADLIETLKDPNDPEREEMLEWLGGEFDPEEFDIEEVNEALKALSRTR
ncbi:MAG: plasmid pRiA4b ORF-3 family protein [Gammaproteobacteria bacterium]